MFKFSTFAKAALILVSHGHHLEIYLCAGKMHNAKQGNITSKGEIAKNPKPSKEETVKKQKTNT